MILWMVAEEILHHQTDGWKPYKPYKQWDKPPVYMIMPTIQYSMPGLHAVG